MSSASAPLGPKKEDVQNDDPEIHAASAAAAFEALVDQALAMAPDERRKRLGMERRKRRRRRAA